MLAVHVDGRAAVSDSIETEIWGRGDTVLISGTVEWRSDDGKKLRGGWSCDLIKES